MDNFIDESFDTESHIDNITIIPNSKCNEMEIIVNLITVVIFIWIIMMYVGYRYSSFFLFISIATLILFFLVNVYF